MSRELQFRNRLRTQRIDSAQLRRLVVFALREGLDLNAYTLCVHLVDDPEMTRVNEQYLRHGGTTDVITFDLREMEPGEGPGGELFVCVPEAVRQARRFRTDWRAEIVRYIVHGVLHLSGFDDVDAAARRVMKREENRLMKALQKRFVAAEFQRISKPE